MKTLRTVRALIREMFHAAPRQLAASIVLLLGLTFTEGAGLLLLLPLLELVGVVDTNPLPRAAGWLESGLGAVGVEPTLMSVLVLFVGIAGLRALLQRWQTSLSATVRENVTSTIRVRLYRVISRAEWKFLVTRRPAELVQMLAGEIGRLGVAAHHVIELTVAAAVALVYIALALRLSASTAALVILCGFALAWSMQGRLGEARESGTRAAGARRKLFAAISEHVKSMKTAKSYDAAGRHADIFVNLSGELRAVSLQVTAGETDLQQKLELSSTILLAVVMYVSLEILALPTPHLLVLLFIYARLMPRLASMYRRAQALASDLPVFEAIAELEQECRDAAEPLVQSHREVILTRSIRFENVTFRYLRREHSAALQNLNLDIEAGRTTAIVGPSGSGKSTIADLLIGLLSPTAGTIRIDGTVLNADLLSDWRRRIGYVPQDTFLFHDTVRANLVWAQPGASDAEVWHALRLAAADEFVAALPQGLDTVVGERGVLISGGERQRLSLARALLRRPQILVLDEATSSLDSETERRIQQAIEGLHHKMTIVIVTHRLSMISGADVVFVIDAGRLAESGNWESLLMQSNGRFAQLCRAQGIHRRPAPTMVDIGSRLRSVNE